MTGETTKARDIRKPTGDPAAMREDQGPVECLNLKEYDELKN